MNLSSYFSTLSTSSLQTVETQWGYLKEWAFISNTQASKGSGNSSRGSPGIWSMDLTIWGSVRAVCWKGHGNPLHILDWRIPWREEPGMLQSMGSQRIRHGWVTEETASFFYDPIVLTT